MTKKLEVELSEQELAHCLRFLQGLSFSLIQRSVLNGDEDETYLVQRSILRLREQLELLLEAIELAREALEP